MESFKMDLEERLRNNIRSQSMFLEYLSRQNPERSFKVPKFMELEEFNKQAEMSGYIENNCAIKACFSGVTGYALGAVFGIFMTSFSANMNSANIHMEDAPKTTIRSVMREFRVSARNSARNFGVFGFLFSGMECIVQKYRAKHDIWNDVYTGLIIGAAGGLRISVKLGLVGAMSMAAFSAAIGKFTGGY